MEVIKDVWKPSLQALGIVIASAATLPRAFQSNLAFLSQFDPYMLLFFVLSMKQIGALC
jgi:hypothetical protein